jgi:PmbA protein
MKTTNMKELAESLVEYGRKKGAGQIQVSINSSNDFNADVREGKIEKLQEAGDSGLSLKVILDNKVATASSSDFAIDTLHGLIDDAIQRAKLTSADPFSALPDKEDILISAEKLEMFDQSVIDMAPEKKIAYALELDKIGKSDKRIKTSTGSSYSTTYGESILANSNGFSGSYKYTRCSAGIGLQAGEGDNFFEDGWYDSRIKLSTMPKPEEIAKIAIERVTRLIGAKKIDSQKVPVIFEPRMTSSLLGFLMQCITGNAIYLSQSFLKDKLNTKIGSDLVNIIDDGTIPGAVGSKPYDGEGVPTRKTVVFENGVLKSYLMSTYSARKLKSKSTGNASGANNLYLSAGKSTLDEMIKSIDKGLLLTNTIGQGTVPTTGDYSKGAYGIWIENGKLSYPVAEITISGSLGKMLSDIVMIGDDLKFNRSITGPSIKIAEMSISGK